MNRFRNARCLSAVILLLVSGAGYSDTPEVVLRGQSLYLEHCANCHGRYGEGDGALAPTMDVVVQDLRYLAARNDGVFPAQFVRDIVDGRVTRVNHGPQGMPIWGAVFASQGAAEDSPDLHARRKIEDLIEFLARMQQEDE